MSALPTTHLWGLQPKQEVRLRLTVCRPGDPPCPSGSDLQSSHCTLGEAFEDLDWETEKGLEAVACDTEGFVPPKVMVRPGHPPVSPAGPGRVRLPPPVAVSVWE